MRRVVATSLVVLCAACPATKEAAPSPASLVALAGDGVSAPAGESIDVVVRVLDGKGQPLPGALVSFRVLEGSGTATPESATSDAAGVARTRWRLDRDTVTNRLMAYASDGAGNTVGRTLTAVGVPGPARTIEKIGDRQSAPARSVITVAYRLFDLFGHRTSGGAATCTVVAGDGTASPGTSPDPAWDGVCLWTLGATPRVENRLTVSAGTATPATFTAWSTVPSSITVRPSDLLKGSRTGVQLSPFGIVWAFLVDSSFEVASVTAHVEGLTTPLAKGTTLFDAQAWVGFTDGATLTRGTVVARITAVDVRGNEGDLFLWFELDRLPVLTITSPVDLSLARSEVTVTASCADDDPVGCTSLVATLGAGTGQTLTGTASIAGTFQLAGLPAGAVSIGFEARDSAGHRVSATRTVWLEPSAHLALLGAAPGQVLDATTTRAFFQVPGEIGIADFTAGDASTTPYTRPVRAGFLWPGGAAFVPESVVTEAWSWVPGAAPVSIGPMVDGSPLQVAGGFGLVTRVGPGPGELQLVRRDLAAATEVIVESRTLGLAGTYQSDLAANGDVVFVVGPVQDLWRYRDGATPLVALTQDGQALGRPRTDGARVIYRKVLAPSDVRAVIWDGADQPLGPATCPEEPCLAIDGAWAALFQPGPSGLGQLWRSGPGGLEQVTFSSQPSALEGLTPDGVLILRNGTTRYRSAPGALDPQPVGTSNGRVVIRDGKALVLLGRSVLEIVP